VQLRSYTVSSVFITSDQMGHVVAVSFLLLLLLGAVRVRHMGFWEL
jgi:hypothetical protein